MDEAMAQDGHHHDALMETARAELQRAHAAAVSMNAAELRRGLELALDAVRQAAALPGALPSGAVDGLQRALAELDGGKLAEMEQRLEQVRAELS